jgi:hypothetical protein
MNGQENTRYAALKQKLLEVGIPIPGTIHALYARCGSPTCPCATDDTKRHGPYYRWHYRLQGRTVAQGINETDMPQFQQWIHNREKIYEIVEEMLEIGVRQAASRTDSAKSSKMNSKKTGTKMRGK